MQIFFLIALILFCNQQSLFATDSATKKILKQMDLSSKKEKKYLNKLKNGTEKDSELLKQLIPALPSLSEKQKELITLDTLQEEIDYIILNRLNILINELEKAGKNFDPNLKINNKSLLEHAVENGYFLSTNRLLSKKALIDTDQTQSNLRLMNFA